MKKNDIVRLRKELCKDELRNDRVCLPKENLPKGMVGTIVMTYGNPPEEIEVEFIDEKSGRTIAVIQLPLTAVELVKDVTLNEKMKGFEGR